jgi:dTDP-glucose 4,6-dehydratase
MKSIVVTGGAGFIGSNFVRYMLAHSDKRVVVVDKLTYAGHLESLADLSGDPRYTFVRADIGDRRAMVDLLAAHRPLALVNFAAETHVDRSIDSPRGFVDTNIVASFELLEALREYLRREGAAGGGGFRFLHVSTDEVYGTLGETGAFREDTPYAPSSPYAATKAAADHLVRAYHATYALPALITNCSNNYGPYQFPEKLIPLMILNAAEGKDLPIYGDGGNVRDWLYVDDHCAAIALVLERGQVGEKYNVGGGSECNNVQVVDRICDLMEAIRPAAENEALVARGAASYGVLKRFVTDRPGHDRRYAIECDKIRRELGWTPRHDFEAGLRETVLWYLDHRTWCRAVQSSYGRERLGLAPEGGA